MKIQKNKKKLKSLQERNIENNKKQETKWKNKVPQYCTQNLVKIDRGCRQW